ncbi:L-histidine N(alpha)-methyltransferase [Aerosticca soli]|uniref:Histidine-specific methyltransferase SAM-dependent domain-containing protein n=1 Tax=Aerosticca soli TaxID=2010829 RepID=A0A2Z6E5D0_9GAMM|nr:L-histidine N(alpha)-methyltransferase [Aerosticca soli]MDI3261613.1 L-histidine N(alpha)-methyltransferase [Fulvimonas sp.]BBD79924.1 hypothetical protein ALSL_1266 [Aerosticca soli]
MNTVRPDQDDDGQPSRAQLLALVQRGLRSRPKRLPSWLFYDERGSRLFERICEQPEYYLTRCEIALLERHAADIARAFGPQVRLVEYGSGNAVKTRLLLEQLEDPVCYVPVELAADALRVSVERLGRLFPELPLQPLCADFTRPLRLPVAPRAPRRTVIYFPGSTLGNFESRDAVALLRKMRGEMGEAGGVLVGVDLKKDPAVIEAAYNDAAGVTADFTLNLLVRLNRELGCDFDLDAFRHRARYNRLAGRVETHLVSQRAQEVRVGRMRIRFAAQEAMLVEYSAKYAPAEFAALANRAGLTVRHRWTDPDGMFAAFCLGRASVV